MYFPLVFMALILEEGKNKTLFVEAQQKIVSRRNARTSCSLDDRITNTHR